MSMKYIRDSSNTLSFNNYRQLILAVLMILIPINSHADNSNSPAFFNYLTDCKNSPSLVAFNPSHFDPRKAIDVSDTALLDLKKDLQALAPAFNGLVLYETLPQLTHAILAEAKAQNYRAVLFGIWDPKNDEEIKETAELIKAFHQQLALAVVIGNEGLLGNRYSLQDIQAAAEKLHLLLPKDTNIPLTTSEPIGEYGLPGLMQFGDFLTPNIHPAVDRDSVEPNEAAAWVKKRALAVAKIGKKPVLVKETGVPNGGKRAYTPNMQLLFWQAYLKDGRIEQVTGNTWVSFAAAFEAFDMSWKAEKSAIAIEGHWGLLDSKRQSYEAFKAWQQAEQSCLSP